MFSFRTPLDKRLCFINPISTSPSYSHLRNETDKSMENFSTMTKMLLKIEKERRHLLHPIAFLVLSVDKPGHSDLRKIPCLTLPPALANYEM